MKFKQLLLRSGAAKSGHRANLGRNVLAAVALTLTIAGAAQAQGYANVTVGGAFAPGVFGQISIGNNPPPPVWNPQPVIYGQPVYGAPIMYLNVPQEETRDWGRYCGRYRACGYPVHFVRVEQNNRWWERRNEYLRGQGNYRQAEERHGDRHDERRGEYRRDSRDDRRDPRDDRRDFNRDPRHESLRGER